MTTQTKSEARPGQIPALIGGVCLLGMSIFVGWGAWKASHPDPVPLQGMVDATTIAVGAKVPGRVLSVDVEEGQSVKAGDIVAHLNLPEIDAKLAQVQAQEAAAKAREELAEVGPRSQEKEAARADLARAVAALEFARSSFNRMESLYKEGLIPAQQFDEVKAKYRAASELVVAAKAKVSALDEGARSEDKAAAKALVAQAASGVAEVQSLVNEAAIKAPMDGEINKIVMKAGEIVPPGYPVVMLTNLKDVWATFNVREDLLPELKKGTEIRGFLPALNKTITWKVEWINARGEYAVWRATRQNSGYDLRTFEVRVRPMEAVEGLRPGMSVIVER